MKETEGKRQDREERRDMIEKGQRKEKLYHTQTSQNSRSNDWK